MLPAVVLILFCIFGQLVIMTVIQLKDLKTKALDVVMESGTPDSLAIALDNVSKKIGLRWNQDLQALPNFKQ